MIGSIAERSVHNTKEDFPVALGVRAAMSPSLEPQGGREWFFLSLSPVTY
jgi:hypothetical protein